MQTISLADAKNSLSKVVDDAATTHLRTTITKNGKPVAILMAIEDFESWEETQAVRSDPRSMAAIREAEDPHASWTDLEEVEALVAARPDAASSKSRRLPRGVECPAPDCDVVGTAPGVLRHGRRKHPELDLQPEDLLQPDTASKGK